METHLLAREPQERSWLCSLKTTALVSKAYIILPWHGMWVAGTHGKVSVRSAEYRTLQ